MIDLSKMPRDSNGLIRGRWSLLFRNHLDHSVGGAVIAAGQTVEPVEPHIAHRIAASFGREVLCVVSTDEGLEQHEAVFPPIEEISDALVARLEELGDRAVEPWVSIRAFFRDHARRHARELVENELLGLGAMRRSPDHDGEKIDALAAYLCISLGPEHVRSLDAFYREAAGLGPEDDETASEPEAGAPDLGPPALPVEPAGSEPATVPAPEVPADIAEHAPQPPASETASEPEPAKSEKPKKKR